MVSVRLPSRVILVHVSISHEVGLMKVITGKRWKYIYLAHEITIMWDVASTAIILLNCFVRKWTKSISEACRFKAYLQKRCGLTLTYRAILPGSTASPIKKSNVMSSHRAGVLPLHSISVPRTYCLKFNPEEGKKD